MHNGGSTTEANINIEIKYINECNILMNIVKPAKYTKSDNNNILPVREVVIIISPLPWGSEFHTGWSEIFKA